MSTPHGRDWIGVAIALAVLVDGLVLLHGLRAGNSASAILLDLVLGLVIAITASAIWAAWAYLRPFDRPGRTPHEED